MSLNPPCRKISLSMAAFVFCTVLLVITLALPENKAARVFTNIGLATLQASLAGMTTAVVDYACKPLLRKAQRSVESAAQENITSTKITSTRNL